MTSLQTALNIRVLGSNTGFERAITCHPNRLTVLSVDGEEEVANVIDFIRRGNAPMDVRIRVGSRELHPSEIYLVDGRDIRSSGKTVREILDGVSPEAKLVDEVLIGMGLLDSAERRVDELDPCSLKRLGLACAVFSKAKVVLYERPFAAVSPSRVDAVAEVLAHVAKSSDQIFLATGIEKIPSRWKGHDDVVVERFTSLSASGSKNPLSLDAVEGELDKFRTMVSENHSESGSRKIYTRPQKITRARAAVPEALQSEAIMNPHLSKMVSGSEQNGSTIVRKPTKKSTGSTRRDSGSMRKGKGSGSLTRVSMINRVMRRSPILSWLKSFKDSFSALATDSNYSQLLPSQAKIAANSKQYRFHRILGLLALVALICTAGVLLNFSH